MFESLQSDIVIIKNIQITCINGERTEDAMLSNLMHILNIQTMRFQFPCAIRWPAGRDYMCAQVSIKFPTLRGLINYIAMLPAQHYFLKGACIILLYCLLYLTV